MGPSQLLPRPHQRRARGGGAGELPHPILRGGPAPAHHLRRSRAGGDRAAPGSLRRAGRGEGRHLHPPARHPPPPARPRRSAMPKKRSTAASPKAPLRPGCCARSPTCSTRPSRPTGSRSTTTAISRAPTRSARWSSPGRRFPQGPVPQVQHQGCEDHPRRRFRHDARGLQPPLRPRPGRGPRSGFRRDGPIWC